MSGAPDGLDGAVSFFFITLFLFCVLFFFVEKIYEFLFVPGVVAEQRVGHGAAVDHYFLTGLEFRAWQVAGCGPQRGEEQGGGPVFAFARER